MRAKVQIDYIGYFLQFNFLAVGKVLTILLLSRYFWCNFWCEICRRSNYFPLFSESQKSDLDLIQFILLKCGYFGLTDDPFLDFGKKNKNWFQDSRNRFRIFQKNAPLISLVVFKVFTKLPESRSNSISQFKSFRQQKQRLKMHFICGKKQFNQTQNLEERLKFL